MRHQIEFIMYAPKTEVEQPLLRAMLHAISLLYGGVQVLRRIGFARGWLRARRLPCKVISIGNLAVGGTGKTPMTAYIAKALEQIGQRVVVVSRGYKGRGGHTSHVVSDGEQIVMDASHTGDEAQLLARQLKSIPVLIGKDRYQAGLDAIGQFKPDVIILDDGFQHLRLNRDLDLVLLDDAAPFGNGHLLPRGILREPARTLATAQGVIFTRAVPDKSASAADLDFLQPDMAVFKSVHEPYHYILPGGRSDHQGTPAASHDFKRLENAPVAVFSGIARNDDFQHMLESFGAKLVSTQSFNDHHPYTRAELDRIAAEAQQAGADFITTTEKDFMRLPADFQWPLDLMVVGVEIDFGKQGENFLEFLRSRLEL